MLAQNFLTAEELNLTDKAHAALIKVLGMMDRGELVWTTRNKPVPNGFNMGTIGCIKGWAEKVGGDGVWIRNYMANCYVSDLFMPPAWRDGLHTLEQAAHALRTYLVTGTPEWV